MSELFDAYSQWFDISRDRRPPNHYELLGLEVLDSNFERIETAFQKRYALVRRYQVGEHGNEALRVLKELAKAHDCLSDKDAKERYDHALLQEFPDLVPQAEVIDAEPEPEVPVEQRKIWVIMPAEGRRWGPLVKSQIEQAVSQGRIRSDYYFQQDDWLEPRPVTEFFRNLPTPPPARLTPIQPGSHFGVRQVAAPTLTTAQMRASYGVGASAKLHPATRETPARPVPWKVIFPCIAVGLALVILIPLSLAIFGIDDSGEKDDESSRSLAEVGPSKTRQIDPADKGSTADSQNTPRNSSISPQGSTRVSSSATSGATVSVQDWRTWNRDTRFGAGRDHVAISPDGELLATVDNGVTIRRVSDAKFVIDFTLGQLEKVVSLRFSPDSKMLAIGTSFGAISLWHREEGAGGYSKVSREGIADLSFFSDGKTLACRYGYDSVALYRVRDLALVKSFKATGSDGNPVRLEGLAISPTDGILAVVGMKHISTWDAEGTKKLWEVATDKLVCDACFSPDGLLLAVRATDKFEVYDASNGKRLVRINSRRGPSTNAKELVFARDGTTLAVSARGMIELWRVPRTEMIKKVSVPLQAEPLGLSLSADGRVMAVAGSRLVVLLRGKSADVSAQNGETNLASGKSSDENPVHTIPDSVAAEAVSRFTWQEVEQVKGECFQAKFSPDGKLLAAASRYGPVRLIDVATGRVVRVLSSGERDIPYSCAFSNDGTYLAAGRGKGKIDVWRTSDGERVARISLPETSSVFGVAFTPGNQTLICLHGFKPVSVVEIATGQRQTAINPVVGQSFRGVAASPDGTKIAVLASRVMYVLRLADQQVLWQKGDNELPGALHVTYSPDGRLLAVRGPDSFSVISAVDGSVLKTVASTHVNATLHSGLTQFSRDGRLLLVAAEKHAELWNWQSADRIGSFLASEKNSNSVRTVALGPDGTAVATTVPTGSLKLWRGSPRPGSQPPATDSSSADNGPKNPATTRGSMGLVEFR